MTIKKILVVPSDRIVKLQKPEKDSDKRGVLRKFAHHIKYKLGRGQLQYDAEMIFCSDIPIVLGQENVFVLNSYQKHYFRKKVPDNCPYPSCLNPPVPTFISEQQLSYVMREVNAVLVSSHAGLRGFKVIEKAKVKDIPVAIIDVRDHESDYSSADIQKNMYGDFVFKEQCDLYFKKDLPVGYKTDTLLPLVPTPVRPESFEFKNLAKETDIFYSGRRRKDKCQPDRAETVELVRENIKNADIVEHEGRSSFMPIREYWDKLSRCRISLSPSGRVWDSFRHCEVGLAKSTVLLVPRPYLETVEPYLEDGENAILYDTELRGCRYHLKNKSEFIEKVKHYLNDESRLQKMADRWKNDVMTGHTIAARSKYIIESMEKLF